MASTYRFLAIGDEVQQVRKWFEQLQPPPDLINKPHGTLLFFKAEGDLVLDGSQRVDPRRSPLVSIFEPETRRGVLTTAGEVHFVTTGLDRAFPGLDRTRKAFRKWLAQFEIVFDGRGDRAGPFDYYLQGSLRNYDTPIFALPLAYDALAKGAYFVDDGANAYVLDKLCKALALRGVACADSSSDQ